MNKTISLFPKWSDHKTWEYNTTKEEYTKQDGTKLSPQPEATK